MASERITVTAADLQPGDRVYRGPTRGIFGLEDHTVRVVAPVVFVDGERFIPEARFTVDRPVPTATLTFDVPESKREAVEQAVQRVLDEGAFKGTVTVTRAPWTPPPPVKVGDRVRRTLPPGDGDGGRTPEYQPGAKGTVTHLYLNGGAAVLVDNDTAGPGYGRTWRAGSFDVVPS